MFKLGVIFGVEISRRELTSRRVLQHTPCKHAIKLYTELSWKCHLKIPIFSSLTFSLLSYLIKNYTYVVIFAFVFVNGDLILWKQRFATHAVVKIDGEFQFSYPCIGSVCINTIRFDGLVNWIRRPFHIASEQSNSIRRKINLLLNKRFSLQKK